MDEHDTLELLRFCGVLKVVVGLPEAWRRIRTFPVLVEVEVNHELWRGAQPGINSQKSLLLKRGRSYQRRRRGPYRMQACSRLNDPGGLDGACGRHGEVRKVIVVHWGG